MHSRHTLDSNFNSLQVGLIETWKEEPGVQIPCDHLGRDYLDRMKDIFLKVLIDLARGAAAGRSSRGGDASLPQLAAAISRDL